MNLQKLCQSCGICCCETEMELSNQDIINIENGSSSKISRKDFVEQRDGFNILKNFDGFCVFFDPLAKLCKIYEFRPLGCRFYPMIYDTSGNKCLLDKDCPHRSKFYRKKPSFQITCENLKEWIYSELLPEK